MAEDGKNEVNFEYLRKIQSMWVENAGRLMGASMKGNEVSLGIAEMSVYAPVQSEYMKSVEYILKLFRSGSEQAQSIALKTGEAHSAYALTEENNAGSLHLNPGTVFQGKDN